jgi:hypothetical protein
MRITIRRWPCGAVILIRRSHAPGRRVAWHLAMGAVTHEPGPAALTVTASLPPGRPVAIVTRIGTRRHPRRPTSP